ncbi:MAG: biosynthetic arginine decarboxylase, partial [Gammaproteobacteria bacterium]|nr:biosynthetic arginine decarboxylase [Gammaproteobacteria bacterium]
IRDIQRCIREAARFYTEVRALGVPIEVMDVGGGLGVHYDGGNSAREFSMNYGVEQYAEVIVQALGRAAEKAGEPQPEIISESGRAIAAHHAVLITSVIDAERKPQDEPRAPDAGTHATLRALWRLYEQAACDNPHAIHAEAAGVVDELLSLFNHGLVSLAERARAEVTWYALCRRLSARLDAYQTADSSLAETLDGRLADRLFINLSIFQSLPDIWGIGQLFPIMPLARLNEAPTRRATLHDLTCDSDGRIDRFVGEDGVASTLAVHAPDGRPYRLGIFLVGAYQEIIGDMHNLFGDTHAVNVEIHGAGYRIRDTRDGNNTADMLRYVHIPPHALARTWRRRLASSGLDAARRSELLGMLLHSLKSYTYLER